MATRRNVDATTDARRPGVSGATVPVLVVDVGDVLIHTSNGAQYHELARRTGLHPQGVAQLVEASGLPHALECGEIADVEFIDAVRELLSWTRLTRQDVWQSWAAVLVGIEPIVAGVVARWAAEHRLVLASNTNALHWPVVCRMLEQAGITAPAFLSFQMGVTKPDPRFFARIIDDDPSWYASAHFVDDRLDNVAAATACGFDGWLHRDPVATAAFLSAVLADTS